MKIKHKLKIKCWLYQPSNKFKQKTKIKLGVNKNKNLTRYVKIK